jgi:hypothetical protein
VRRRLPGERRVSTDADGRGNGQASEGGAAARSSSVQEADLARSRLPSHPIRELVRPGVQADIDDPVAVGRAPAHSGYASKLEKPISQGVHLWMLRVRRGRQPLAAFSLALPPRGATEKDPNQPWRLRGEALHEVVLGVLGVAHTCGLELLVEQCADLRRRLPTRSSIDLAEHSAEPFGVGMPRLHEVRPGVWRSGGAVAVKAPSLRASSPKRTSWHVLIVLRQAR